MKSKIEKKSYGFTLMETKELDSNNVKIGYIKGYASTFEKDRVNHMIQKGAFMNSLKENAQRGDRPIRMLWNHNEWELIGGFPTAKEDDKGLFVEGHINLETRKGAEAYALAKQGVLTDMSVGFIPRDEEIIDGVRVIKDLLLLEISFVPEPANMGAVVTEVKKATEFEDLPLAEMDYEWDSEAAIVRVREFTNSVEAPSEDYERAFFWFDEANDDNFGAYKLPFADVIDGRLHAVPRGIAAAAGAIKGARGGVDIPDSDIPTVISHIQKYYDKMEKESPFTKGLGLFELRQMRLEIIQSMFENIGLSKKAARFCVDAYKDAVATKGDDTLLAKIEKTRQELLTELKKITMTKEIK